MTPITLIALCLGLTACTKEPALEEIAGSEEADVAVQKDLAANVFGLSETCAAAGAVAANVDLAETNDAEVREMLTACASVAEFHDALLAYPNIIGIDMTREETESWVLTPLCETNATTPVCIDLAAVGN